MFLTTLFSWFIYRQCTLPAMHESEKYQTSLHIPDILVAGVTQSFVFRVLLLLQGVNNFVQYKFSHLPSKERQTIVELAKMFLNQINYWQLETPSQRRQRAPDDDVAGYKVNYTR